MALSIASILLALRPLSGNAQGIWSQRRRHASFWPGILNLANSEATLNPASTMVLEPVGVGNPLLQVHPVHVLGVGAACVQHMDVELALNQGLLPPHCLSSLTVTSPAGACQDRVTMVEVAVAVRLVGSCGGSGTATVAGREEPL